MSYVVKVGEGFMGADPMDYSRTKIVSRERAHRFHSRYAATHAMRLRSLDGEVVDDPRSFLSSYDGSKETLYLRPL